jgi:4-alpha-glucanotransferase
VAGRSPLVELAERAGIASGYTAAGSGAWRRTSPTTRAALLSALGFDVSDRRAAARALAALPKRAAAGHRGAAPACVDVGEILGGRRVFGLWTNLYTLRRAGGLGFGDLGALRQLIDLAACWGAQFVGLPPLHALRNRGPEISPYAPLSRLYRNPLYLEVEAVPELAGCAEARRRLEAPDTRRRLAALREARQLDLAACAALQRELLEPLHADFARLHRDRDSARGRAFEDYRARAGPSLGEFARFLALEDHLAARGFPRDWRRWPPEFRGPGGAALEAFAEREREAVSFHEYVQFELDRQLAALADAARRAGLAIGLYQDLALGSAASGFDVWAHGERFVEGATLGAPPDDYALHGQDWGLPPLHPLRIASAGAPGWREVLRAAFAHAGALRIDHVMGLVRQFWVPAGRPASEGAYVRFPARELLDVLAEESRRAGALAIGEDLGTVPRGLPSLLARRHVLSSRVLMFERDRAGRFRPASRYSPRALVTANTHDLPPLAAFWSGADLCLRHELGLLEGAALARARAERAADRRALERRLVRDGLLPRDCATADVWQRCAAVNAFLCRTPSPLVGLSLDDLAGEEEPVNLPGVPTQVHPSWTRRMRLSLEEMARHPGLARAVDGASSRVVR